MKTPSVKPKLHSGHMKVAVANLIGYRTHVIVPNVSWGWNLRHEADLIAVNSGNKVTEIEIKVSLSDLKADFKKEHGHRDYLNRIGRLVYAVPVELRDAAAELIPENCGIITVKWNGYRYSAEWYRATKYRKDVQPISDRELISLMRLGAMRIWSLKQHNNK